MSYYASEIEYEYTLEVAEELATMDMANEGIDPSAI